MLLKAAALRQLDCRRAVAAAAVAAASLAAAVSAAAFPAAAVSSAAVAAGARAAAIAAAKVQKWMERVQGRRARRVLQRQGRDRGQRQVLLSGPGAEVQLPGKVQGPR